MLDLVCNQRLQRGLFFLCVLIPSEHLLSLHKVETWDKHGGIRQVPTSASHQGNCRNTDLSDLQ